MFVDRAVGIDLGTTNSEIALLDPSERDIVVHADKFGRRTVPSAVAWDPGTASFLVGRAARQRRGSASPPVESIKRRMGLDAKVTLGPHELTPEEVSSKILAELRDRMREDLAKRAPTGVDARVSRAVITVPAYFDAPQIEATRRAGELAGLEVIGVLQEPTAAAIYHTWKSQLGDGVFLVYDLGGGTFDVSVLRCLAGEYQVLAIDGDNWLGGDDFDRRFAEHLRKKLLATGYALELDVRGDREDERRFLRLVHLAQEIKESLSTAESVHISRQDLLLDKGGESVSLETEITRAEWDACVEDLVTTTLRCCERALARATEVAGVSLADVDHVILVGGSTRVPLVMKRVVETLCTRDGGGSKARAPLQAEVDTCVALGAAVHAAILGGFRVGDDEAAIRFTTPLVSRAPRMRLGMAIEQAPAGTLAIELRHGDGALARFAMPELGAVTRTELALPDDPDIAMRACFLGDGDRELASLPFALYRGEVRPRASALSQPAVVAKDIAVEVVRAGRRERKVLVPRGASLPLEQTHALATADRSGAVVLRLMQNRLPIKTLVLEVPEDTPVGTPVELVLRCDPAMRLEAKATVLGRELWARIEPAKDSAVPTESIEALLAEAETTAVRLWGRDAALFRREHELLATGLREVLTTDPDKVAALASRLRALLEEFRGREDEGELSPPLHRFEHVLDGLRRTVYSVADRPEAAPLLGMERAAWQQRIDDLDRRGRDAWTRLDALEWRRVYDEAQALSETAYTQVSATLDLDDTSYIARRRLGLGFWASTLARSLEDFVASSSPEVSALQTAERDRLRNALADNVQKRLSSGELDAGSPYDVRRRLEGIAAELTRIEAALERLPSIGLVSERR